MVNTSQFLSRRIVRPGLPPFRITTGILAFDANREITLIKAYLLLTEDYQIFLDRMKLIIQNESDHFDHFFLILKKKNVLSQRIKYRGGLRDDLNLTMSVFCNLPCYMLKDMRIHLLLFLFYRKELSFCHSCYTQISLLQLRHQLIYMDLVQLDEVRRLSIPRHLQRKGGNIQLLFLLFTLLHCKTL